jgi:hypothetical protein
VSAERHFVPSSAGGAISKKSAYFEPTRAESGETKKRVMRRDREGM